MGGGETEVRTLTGGTEFLLGLRSSKIRLLELHTGHVAGVQRELGSVKL